MTPREILNQLADEIEAVQVFEAPEKGPQVTDEQIGKIASNEIKQVWTAAQQYMKRWMEVQVKAAFMGPPMELVKQAAEFNLKATIYREIAWAMIRAEFPEDKQEFVGIRSDWSLVIPAEPAVETLEAEEESKGIHLVN